MKDDWKFFIPNWILCGPFKHRHPNTVFRPVGLPENPGEIFWRRRFCFYSCPKPEWGEGPFWPPYIFSTALFFWATTSLRNPSYVVVMSSSWNSRAEQSRAIKVPSRPEPIQAELGYLNFRAENELAIFFLMYSFLAKIFFCLAFTNFWTQKST